jgi:hypothetical protein
MLIDHLQHAALPSSDGHTEDDFGALRETISFMIAASLSNAVVACV